MPQGGKPRRRSVASTKHPSIKAVLDQKYRLAELEDAQHRLKILREHFITSKEQGQTDSLRLWIEGFALTTPEKKKGFQGHYARIRIRKLSQGYYTLIAEKQEVELSLHPQKRRPKQTHPDWGHPVLRAVKKKKQYETEQEAQQALDELHTAFPRISIPQTGKMHIIVYGALPENKQRTQKYVLTIRKDEQGLYFIESRLNVRQTGAVPKALAPKGQADVKGRFTEKVVTQRKRRKKA